jgi:hypothetical protein
MIISSANSHDEALPTKMLNRSTIWMKRRMEARHNKAPNAGQQLVETLAFARPQRLSCQAAVSARML